jgi:glycosyltransferase involved in cell wall biosynthesis
MARPSPPAPDPRRVRVVTLIDYMGTFGGAEGLALSVATRLDPERFESTLCVSRWPLPGAPSASSADALEQLSASGTRVLGLGRHGKLDAWVWTRLARFLRRERVDVLHAHKFGSNLWGTLLGRVTRVPVVLAHEHTWSYEGKPLRRFLDRQLIARGADRFIAVSREDQRRMIEIEHIDARDTLFIPNGVVSMPPPSDRDVRAELRIPSSAQVIGVVGGLRPQKAHHVLLSAAALLIERWPGLHTLIIGDGPERASLERLTAELDLQNTVHFLGSRTDVPDLLSALDIAVCCSDFEGSPLSVMEYMDASLPVVASAVGGLPELIEPGVHGLLVPPNDPPALAAALAELLDDPARARAMGVRARERRRSEFGIDSLVHRLEDLYVRLLAEKRR